ncbi:MAG: ADP-ribosyltransferase [Sulfobacillus sp.]
MEPIRCPAPLLPVDGKCPKDFPLLRKYVDGSREFYCCSKSVGKGKKKSLREDCESTDEWYNSPEFKGEMTFSNPIEPEEMFLRCLHPPRGDPPLAAILEYHDQFPSNQWLALQQGYCESLSPTAKKYVELYTHFGDRLLNSFLRGDTSDWVMDYLPSKSSEFVDFFLQRHLVTLRDFLLEFLRELQAMIKGAPKTDRHLVLYRGQNASDNFARGTVDRLYVSLGVLSTSWQANVAMKFAKGQTRHLVKIVLPPGYPAFYLGCASYHAGEEEIILPHGATFYVTSPTVAIERRTDDYPKYRSYTENSILMVGQRAVLPPPGWDIPLTDVCRRIIEYNRQFDRRGVPYVDTFMQRAIAADNPRMVALAQSMK